MKTIYSIEVKGLTYKIKPVCRSVSSKEDDEDEIDIEDDDYDEDESDSDDEEKDDINALKRSSLKEAAVGSS